MRALARGGRKRPLISLTPLIDVVFFMPASSFTDWRAIDLGPSGGPAGAAPQPETEAPEETEPEPAPEPTPAPPDVPGDMLDVTVPIVFALR